MVLIFFWMLAEAAQKLAFTHCLERFFPLFCHCPVTLRAGSWLTLGSSPCVPGLGGFLVDPDVFLLLPQVWDPPFPKIPPIL